MIPTQYLALLRGINVGGSNIIKMAALKDCFESIGLTDVISYIQSGNIIFKSVETDKIKLQNQLEKTLSDSFSYNSTIVLIPHSQFIKIIDDAPPGFGTQPKEYRYDVIFLRENLTPREIIKTIRKRDGVDTAESGNYALYFSRLISRVTQSQLKYIMTLPEYREMTIRNWNTTKKIFELMNNHRTK